MPEILPPLTPITSPWMHQAFANPKLLDQLFAKFGSPINIINTVTFQENIQSFKAILDKHHIKNQIFYARKANKCRSFAIAVANYGEGVDTASYNELHQCLKMGISPDQLLSTCVIKTDALIKLAIEAHVLLVVDNMDEIDHIAALASQLGMPAKIAIRLSGFNYQKAKLYSRFGFDIEEDLPHLWGKLFSNSSYQHLNFQGLHFHLDGYSTQQRGVALAACLEVAKHIREVYRIATRFIDIGGGILTNYLQHAHEWENFKTELHEALKSNRSSITYRNDGLGYTYKDGKIHGRLETYPYFNEIHGASFLEEIITYKGNSGKINSHLLVSDDIELRMEPGRALLSQCGMTMARVIHQKQHAFGDVLVGLEMNMTQMMTSSADFLSDPAISYKDRSPNSSADGVYFTGAYCLERDIILKRKIAVSQIPQRGDAIAFFNTAGYFMHFFETEAHLFDLSNNLLFESDSKTEPSLDNFQLD